MRAVVCHELGGIDRLRLGELPTPEAGPGEVLVRVTAAGLNFADLLMIKGEYQEKPPLPFAPGLEIAGRIERLGDGVDGFSEGQRVMATVSHGGFAEFAVARAGDIVAVPDNVEDAVAAGFAIAYGTAYGSLRWATHLNEGETLVVHGAAGGVGLATVECRQGTRRHRHRHGAGRGAAGGGQGPRRRSRHRHAVRKYPRTHQGAHRRARRRRRVRSDRRRRVRGVAQEHRLGRAPPGDRLRRRPRAADPRQHPSGEERRRDRVLLGQLPKARPGQGSRPASRPCSTGPAARSSIPTSR